MLTSICLALTFTTNELTDPGYTYAADLAARHQAHLSAVIGLPEYLLTIAAAPEVMAAAELGELDERNLQEAQALADRIAGSGMADRTARAEVVQGLSDTVADRVARQARLCDLAVVTHPGRQPSFDRTVAQHLLFASGTPVILVPDGWRGGAEPRRVLVAWDGSAKASRAVRDSLPVIKTAQHVEVVCVSGEKDLSHEIPGADLAESLSRHCASVGTVTLPAGENGVAQTLLTHAELTRADLVVMGAYAHSRIRELIFGGVTRGILGDADRPVLMSF